MTLNDLKLGEKGIVTKTFFTGSDKRRVADLGIVKGSEIVPLHKSPFHDPTAYLIKGAVVAIRKKDAKRIRIERGEQYEKEEK